MRRADPRERERERERDRDPRRGNDPRVTTRDDPRARDQDDRADRRPAARRDPREPIDVNPRVGTENYNDYFLPGDDISREVIQMDITRYLGGDATARPYTHKDGRKGFLIKAFRALTTEQIRSLKESSLRFEKQRDRDRSDRRQERSYAEISRDRDDDMDLDDSDDDSPARPGHQRQDPRRAAAAVDPRNDRRGGRYTEPDDDRLPRKARDPRDPRDVREDRDPRAARDPRYGNDPRYGPTRRSDEDMDLDPDPRAGFVDPRDARNDPRYDARLLDRRDPRDDPRLADPRLQDVRGMDPRMQPDPRQLARDTQQPVLYRDERGREVLIDPRTDPRADPRADPRIRDPRDEDPRFRQDPRYATGLPGNYVTTTGAGYGGIPVTSPPADYPYDPRLGVQPRGYADNRTPPTTYADLQSPPGRGTYIDPTTGRAVAYPAAAQGGFGPRR